MKQKVIVIGQGFTGRLSIIRSVAEIGCEVIIIALVRYLKDGKTLNTKMPIDGYSKYVSNVHFCYSRGEEDLIDILLERCTDKSQKPIIFPDNDFSASIIDQHYDTLKEHFLLPYIDGKPGEITLWMDKMRQKNLASQLGLNVAKSQVIETKNGKYDLDIKEISFPVFVKPLFSIIGGKAGLKRCNNETELKKHFDLISQNYEGVKLLIEDFKKIEKEFAVLGFSDGKDVVIPGIIEIKKLAHGSHFGVALQGKVMPVAGHEALMDKFKDMVLRIGFVGVFDIDFYLSDGEMFFGELNWRFGGSGYAYTKSGVNLPAMMVRSFLGQNVDDMKKSVNQCATFLNERMAIDDWYLSYMTTSDYHKLEKESDIRFVEDDKDLLPQKKLNDEFRIKLLKRTIKRIIGKK